jgi:hypothetical protein
MFMKGYGEVETELLGKVKKEQMYLPNSDEWLLRRISPNCENNCGNEHYNINTSYIELVVFIPVGRMQEVYKIICPECGETIELEMEEFRLIKPFIKINKLLESGKIDEIEYKNRLDKIESRLLKLRRD